MSVDLFIPDYEELLEIELTIAGFSSEEIKRLNSWKSQAINDYNEDSLDIWKEYQDKIAIPFEEKYTMNFSNANFRKFAEMLGIMEETFISDNDSFSEDAPELTGGLEGADLDILRSRVDTLIKFVQDKPEQFHTEGYTFQAPGCSTDVVQGRTAKYYIRKLEELALIIKNANKIVWG